MLGVMVYGTSEEARRRRSEIEIQIEIETSRKASPKKNKKDNGAVGIRGIKE